MTITKIENPAMARRRAAAIERARKLVEPVIDEIHAMGVEVKFIDTRAEGKKNA